MNIFGTTGQERRAWLDRQGQNVLDAIQYYAGPGIPVNAFATIADAFNPVADIQRAGTAARGAVQPGISPMERLGYVGSAATDMASVLAPVAGAAYADDAARGLTEGLANLTMPADDVAARFIASEAGSVGPRTAAEAQAQEVLDLLTSGRASEVTDDMLAAADPQYLYRNYDLPMDEALRMARAREMGLLPRGSFRGAHSDVAAFQENPIGRNFSTFGDPSGTEVTRAGTFFSDNPQFANEYAAFMDDRGRVTYPEGSVVGEYATPLAQPLPHPYDVTEWARATGDDEAFMATRWANPGWEMLDNEAGQAVKRYAETYPKPPRAFEFGESAPSLFDENVDVESTSSVVFDPANIRSRFARFDPRLAHLRNLSAGVGGLGIVAGSQSEEERSEEINAILAKYGV